jgi:hypothetical protein
MRRIELIAFAAAALAFATPAAAQGRGKGKAKNNQTSAGTIYRGGDGVLRTSNAAGRSRVPPGHLPPAGMCRVWIDGVPPGHQPPVTDCGTAQAQRTANSRVIYGDDTPFPGRGRKAGASNDRVGSINGRQCVERRDVYGNVRYDCEDDRDDRRTDRRRDRRDGTYDPIGVLTGRTEADRRDDDYRYQNDVRGAEKAGKVKQKAKKGKGN